jgi:hypothetical protein
MQVNKLDKTAFFMEFKRVMEYLALYEKTTPQTIDLYFSQLKIIPADLWVKTIDYLIKTWQYKHLPLIADFLASYRAIRPTTSNYTPYARDDGAVNPMVAIRFIRDGLKCQDIAKKQLLQPRYGGNYDSALNYIEKKDLFKDFLKQKIQENECFSLQSEKWVHRDNAVVAGNFYYYPEQFGW